MPSLMDYSMFNYLKYVINTLRVDPRDDAELVAHFAKTNDEAAFATLVYRHGTEVWQTCRRVLGDTPDAEDAFQATFLVLAAKRANFPSRICAAGCVALLIGLPWTPASPLNDAIALNEKLKTMMPPEPELKQCTDRDELYAALNSELSDLPEKLRVPLVLHYLGRQIARRSRPDCRLLEKCSAETAGSRRAATASAVRATRAGHWRLFDGGLALQCGYSNGGHRPHSIGVRNRPCRRRV